MALRTDKNLRAGLYARVSTENRGQDPETQLRPLREYAERRGFAVVGEFVDHASGTTESRPRYQRLLEAARKRELDVVLVWRYDRFARSTRALVNALGEFKARGGSVGEVGGAEPMRESLPASWGNTGQKQVYSPVCLNQNILQDSWLSPCGDFANSIGNPS